MDERSRLWGVTALMIALASAIAALVATDTAHPPVVEGIDAWWRNMIAGAGNWAQAIARGFYAAGLGAVTVPLRIAVAAWLVSKRRHPDAAAWVVGWLLADLLTSVLKTGVGRPRPDGSDLTSFPSGHAKSAAQMGIGLLLLLPGPSRLRVAVPVGLWILGMAVSRTVLDHHWLSDVVAGSLLGAGCALGAAAAFGVAMPACFGRDSPHGLPDG